MELRDYLDVIRNRKWIVIQSILIITTVAIVASLLQKPVYEAEAIILFKEKTTGVSLFGQALAESGLQPERFLQTQIELIQVRPLAAKVVNKLSLSLTPEELLQKVEVEPEGQTNIIRIKVQDGNPRLARDIANEIAVAYIDWSKESTLEEVEKARKEIFYKRRDAEEDIVLLGEMLARRPGTESKGGDSEALPTGAPEELKAKLGMASSLYTVLSEKHEELRIMEALRTGGAQLVAPAVSSGRPVRPKPISNGTIAFLASLVFGLGLAFMIEYMDNTIKTSEDVRRYYDLPVLGEIPLMDVNEDGSESRLVCKVSPRAAESEAFRSLRTNIQYLNFDQSICTLVVAGAVPKEGKSDIAANLAVTLAQAGSQVIIICCDLRQPSLQRIFGSKKSTGLSDILAGSVSFEEALQDVGIDNLKFIASGPLPPNPSELLGSKRMKEVLEKAKSLADIVILDTPPVLAVTDCTVLAPQVDGVMIVASCGLATRESARHIKRTLGNVGARLLGVVLNNVQVSQEHSYYYYYGSSAQGMTRRNSRRRRRGNS